MVANRASIQPQNGEPAVTPMAFAKAIVLAYEHRNLDASGALHKARIAPDQLQFPDARMTAWQMEVLSEAAMRELDDEALGCLERRLPWGSYGMLARASLGSTDLGRALKRWCRHHGLIAEGVTLAVTETGGEAILSLAENRDMGPLREFGLLSILRNVYGLACWLIDSRLPLLEAAFPVVAPPHADVYPVLFAGAPVHFGAEGLARLRFDADYLLLPLRRDEAALNQMLQRALPLTVRQYRRDRLLVQRVRQVLRLQPEAAQNAEALAGRLNLSVRTLHRQLRDEGASLQGLKDEVREQVAREALLRTDRPIKQVAAAAGFSSEKSFIRAFKGWTGQAPGEFRSSAIRTVPQVFGHGGC